MDRVAQHNTIDVRVQDSVATITMKDRRTMPVDIDHDVHADLYQAFAACRSDDTIRVVVLTGIGTAFHQPPAQAYGDPKYREYRNDASSLWKTFANVVRLIETMISMEKPIVARVNGDAVGFGSSLLFASDLVVAVSGATVADYHLGKAASEDDAKLGMIPGDGGAALVPLVLPPALAKEYLFLGRPLTTDRLAELGIINHAVDATELDAAVDDVVTRLLARPAHTLAWTKRLTTRAFVGQVVGALDAAAALEMVDFLQWERAGWQQPRRLL